MRDLVRHPYSGNVRELLALVLDAIRQSEGDELEARVGARIFVGSSRPASEPAPLMTKTDQASQVSCVDAVPTGGLTAEQVQASLDANNGALERTWRALGLPNRHVLRRLIQRYRLEVRRRPK